MELQRIKKDDCMMTRGQGVVRCCSTNTISLIGSWF